MKKILTVLVVTVIIGAGVWVVIDKQDNPSDNTANSNTSQQTGTNQANNDFGSSQTITYNDVGFSPEKLTSKVGEKVKIENKSSATLAFSSDDHPTHTKNPELNLAPIPAGQSATFTPTTKGSFGFHNNLKPEHKGVIVVQ